MVAGREPQGLSWAWRRWRWKEVRRGARVRCRRGRPSCRGLLPSLSGIRTVVGYGAEEGQYRTRHFCRMYRVKVKGYVGLDGSWKCVIDNVEDAEEDKMAGQQYVAAGELAFWRRVANPCAEYESARIFGRARSTQMRNSARRHSRTKTSERERQNFS